jgi:hypothetical protein
MCAFFHILQALSLYLSKSNCLDKISCFLMKDFNRMVRSQENSLVLTYTKCQNLEALRKFNTWTSNSLQLKARDLNLLLNYARKVIKSFVLKNSTEILFLILKVNGNKQRFQKKI